MATTLAQIINAARNKHPAFHKVRVPDVVIASHLSEVQRELMTLGSNVDASRMAVNCNVAFLPAGGSNAPGTVGAGTDGGLPGTIINGVLQMPDGDAGPSVEIDVEDAVMLAADRSVVASDALTATVFGAPGWAINAWVNKVAVITEGAGKGQVRLILSNTANQVTISTGADNQQWATIPDSTSVLRIIDLLLVADGRVNLITRLPPTAQRQGYVVKIDSSGTPFIDVAHPLAVSIDNGLPLPDYERIIGGSVRVNSTAGLDPLTAELSIRTYRTRYLWGPSYTCWFEGGKMFLGGTQQDWANAISVDLRMVPIPPDFALLSDVMLLPDAARPAMVAAAADLMAQRCAGMPDVPAINTDWFQRELDKANDHFIDVIGATARGHAVYVREIY